MRWASGPTPTGEDFLCLFPLRSRASRGRSAPDASGDSVHQWEGCRGAAGTQDQSSAPLAVRGSLPDPDSGVPASAVAPSGPGINLRSRSYRCRR
jgi:hypothetical protein